MRLSDSIDSAKLGKREQKALERLGVTTINELLHLNTSLFFPSSSPIHRHLSMAQERIRELFAQERKKKFSQGSGGDQFTPSYAFMSFEEVYTHLSERARRAIKTLKVKTIPELLAIKEKEVLRIRSVGVGTWKEISDIQKRQARDPAQAAQDHQDLNNLRLGKKEIKVLQRLGVKTVSELINLDASRILHQQGYGKRTYDRVRRAQSRLKRHTVKREFKRMPEEVNLIDPIDKIDSSILGFNEKRILKKKFGVKTIGELQRFEVEKVAGILGFGPRFWRRVFVAQQLLRTQLSGKAERAITQKHAETIDTTPQPSLTFEEALEELGTKGHRALAKLNVNTVKDLNAVQPEDVLGLRGYGRFTWREIAALKYRLLSETQVHVDIPEHIPQTPEEWEQKPATPVALNQLPLYSSIQIENLSPSKLHETYLSGVRLDDLALPPYAWWAFIPLDIKTVGELLLTPSTDLIRQRGFEKENLKTVQNLIRNLILTNGKPTDARVDFSSFASMGRSYVHYAVKNARDADILAHRLGFVTGKISKLREIAEQHAISYQRVLQVANKSKLSLKHPTKIRLLTRFWSHVTEVLYEKGGILEISELSKELKRKFHWTYRPRQAPLKELLSLSLSLCLENNSEVLVARDFPCKKCGKIGDKLTFLFRDGAEEMHVLDVAYRLAQSCRNDCSEDLAVPDSFSRAFVKMAASSVSEVVIEDDHVMKHKRWIVCYGGTLKEVVHQTLELIGQPVHYSELADHIRRQNVRFKDVIDRNVHACLTNYDEFMVTDRGTYGLASWDLKPHKSHGRAIIELLEGHGAPMHGALIISILTREGEYKVNNLQMALYSHPRITEVGANTYDLLERVEESKIARRASELIVITEDD